jgi:hypothetical protein
VLVDCRYRAARDGRDCEPREDEEADHREESQVGGPFREWRHVRTHSPRVNKSPSFEK